MHADRATDQMAETSPAMLLPLLGWFTGALFFFYAWILRVSPSVMVDDLMRDFAAGGALLGNLSAAYYYGYAGMQIPVGLLFDRFGPRRPMAVAALLCACGTLTFATGQSLAAVTLGRFLIGASAAFSFVGSLAVASRWFAPDRFAMLSGISMAMGMIGAVFGQAPVRIAVEASDWRTVSLWLALGGILLAAMATLFVRDKWRGTGGFVAVAAGLARVLKHPQTWLISLAGLGTSAPLLGFAGLWGVPFLAESYSISRTMAASLTSTIFIGWAVGSLLFGGISDRLGMRRAPLALGLTLETLALGAIVYVPAWSLYALTALCFSTGFFGASQVICYALIKETHAPKLSGTGIGFVNGMIVGAGAVLQPLVGWLLDLMWTGNSLAGARVYEPSQYRLALSALLVCGVLGLAGLFAIRETHCRQQV